MTEETAKEAPKKAKKRGFAYWLGVWFGAGLSPIAPGTCGTLFAIPLYLLLMVVIGLPMWAYIIFCAAFIFVAAYGAKAVGAYTGDHDHRSIVIDEVIGYLISTIALAPTVSTVVLAFVLFRLFDIVKPFPANYFDKKVKNHWGCVMDDVLAGVYAAIVGQLLGKLMAKAGWLESISQFWG